MFMQKQQQQQPEQQQGKLLEQFQSQKNQIEPFEISGKADNDAMTLILDNGKPDFYDNQFLAPEKILIPIEDD